MYSSIRIHTSKGAIMEPTVRIAGFLNKGNYLVSYMSRTKKGKKYNKTIRVISVPKEGDDYKHRAHLFTMISEALCAETAFDDIDIESVRIKLLGLMDTLVLHYTEYGNIHGHPLYNIAGRWQEELANAVEVFCEKREFITNIMAKEMTKKEQALNNLTRDIKFTKGSQLLLLDILPNNRVRLECACGCIFVAHSRIPMMMRVCKKCNLEDYRKAEKVISKLANYFDEKHSNS